MSQRTEIRNQVVSAIDGNTDAADRVYPGAVVIGVPLGQLPAVYVTLATAENELITMGDPGARRIRRVVDVEIHCVGHGKTTGEVETALDTLATQCETALLLGPIGGNPGAPNAAMDGWYLAGETTEVLADDTDGVLSDHVLVYRADYTTVEGTNILVFPG